MESNGRAAQTARVTVAAETVTSPTWYTCRACPTGAQRFRIDVGADPATPPARHLAAIRRHFREVHGLRRLPRRGIGEGEFAHGRAVYVPSTPLHGAHLICGMCRAGSNEIQIEAPPFGDARSLSLLAMLYPGLACQITRIDAQTRADRLEEYHRQMVIPRATQWAIDQALRVPGDGSPAPADREVTEGIRTLLATAVVMGTPITRAVPRLVKLMDFDPVVYACAVAAAIPALEVHRTAPPQAVAALTRYRYGRLERTERTLWTIWCGQPVTPLDPRASATRADLVCVSCLAGGDSCALRPATVAGDP